MIRGYGNTIWHINGDITPISLQQHTDCSAQWAKIEKNNVELSGFGILHEHFILPISIVISIMNSIANNAVTFFQVYNANELS